jgi:hypothetical protein
MGCTTWSPAQTTWFCRFKSPIFDIAAQVDLYAFYRAAMLPHGLHDLEPSPGDSVLPLLNRFLIAMAAGLHAGFQMRPGGLLTASAHHQE